MKYFGIVWRGVWRKRTRTIFTLLSIAVAFLLFGMLQGIGASFSQVADSGRLNVLYITNPAGLPLPLAYESKIQSVAGVAGATYRSLFIGYHGSMRNTVLTVPVADNFLALNPQFTMSEEARQAFARERTGVLISESLARRLKWKVGDHVPVHALDTAQKNGSLDWTFDIVGIFDIPGNPAREQSLLLMNYDYFDAARARDTGTAQIYMVTVSDPTRVSEVGTQIDNLFANSAYPTMTETERSNQQSQLAQIGDLEFFVNAIVGAAFATLLLLTGSTLMQSYRERVREFAIMKTLGFTDAAVAAVVVSEAMVLCVSAALLGLLLAQLLLRAMSAASGGSIPGVFLPPSTFAVGMGVAVVIAALSVLPGAIRAKRLQIVAALAVH